MSGIKEKIKKNIKVIVFLVVVSAAFCNNYFYIGNTHDPLNTGKVRQDVSMPPSLTLITVALGPIRGLIVDALWWKVSELQEASEYFEIIRISDWITVLQPNNSFVWTYHAWNLAYNIAYEFPTPETRWKWINSGIKLLRDEGLNLNPDDEIIKGDLSGLFLDRVGGFTDPGRMFYIKSLADIMDKYLPDGNREDIERIAAPSNEKYSKLAFKLKENLKLDPEKMLEVDKKFGPFQWKLPQAQAVYWGAKENSESYFKADVNYKYNVISAMQQAFVFGGLVQDEENGLFVVTNNLTITDNIVNYYNKQISNSQNPVRDKNLLREFIVHAIPILYGFDYKESARKLFEEYEKITPNHKFKGFEHFAINNLDRMNFKSPGRYQQSLVEISLFSGYIVLAQGKFKNAEMMSKIAENKWKAHQAKFAANKVMQMPPFDEVKVAAFVKVLKKYPPDRREKLVDLAHNKLAGKLRLDSKLKFTKYLGE